MKHFTVALLAGLFATSVAFAAEPTKPARVSLPTVNVNKDKAEQCVEPTEVMRRDHMQMILHQRDETMHQGIRTVKHSLKNCVNCHADPKTESVLGHNELLRELPYLRRRDHGLLRLPYRQGREKNRRRAQTGHARKARAPVGPGCGRKTMSLSRREFLAAGAATAATALAPVCTWSSSRRRARRKTPLPSYNAGVC